MSFQQGLSGLNAAAKNLDVIGNNVANASTVGFKGGEAQFADVYAAASSGASGARVGIGTSLARVRSGFSQGNITVSNNPLDMAINGSGFFRMERNGVVSFSRNGQFSLDRNGYIVNGAGENLTGFAANSSGMLVTSAPVPLQIPTADIAPKSTTRVEAGVNLDSRKGDLVSANFDPTNTATYHSATSLSVYDTLGNAHAMSMYFVKTAANTWDVFATLDGEPTPPTAAINLGTLNFNGSTGLLDTTATTLPFVFTAPAITTGADPIVLDMDFTATTQFGSSFGVNALSQDGFQSGRLAGYSVGSDGILQGRYSNGQTKTLGQVVMGNFTNPEGLAPLGGNSYADSADSGPALIGVPGTGSLGAIQSGALEESNIDLTAELVKMITAQRVYQSNAQTIKTQDSVLQTLVNMR